MNRLEEIRARQVELKALLVELGDKETPTDDEARAFQDGLIEWDALLEEAKPLEEREQRMETLRHFAVKDTNREDGMYTPSQVKKQADDIYNLDRAQFSGMERTEVGQTYRDKAMRAIEAWPEHVSDEARSTAEKHVANARQDGNSRKIADHILRTGNPDYVDAFYAYMKNPGPMAHLALTDRQAEAVREARAALAEAATTTGGFMVPPFLDPTIILTNDGATNPFRGISTVKTIATQTWKGVSSAGVTAEWTAEAAEVTDASPTFAQPTVTPIRADAYVQASLEMLEDTDIGMEVAMLMQDARDRLEATAFAVGTGSTQPKGLVTALQAVTASRVAGSSGAAGAADYVVGDVYALANALPPRHRPNSSWLAEQTILNKTRQFATGSGPQHAFWADLGVAIPPLLLGRPVYESSAMDNTIVSGSNDDILILGDFRKFLIVDRIGMEIMYEPLVKGANRRPTGEVGWVAFWRVGSDVLDAGAWRMLRV